jgi:hypothetical protein
MMNKFRRRFKRLVGLEKRITPTHYGGLEHLIPSQITGWVVPLSEPFHEVRLLIGSQLISRSEINQARKDVSEKFGFEGDAGFSLPLSILHHSVDLNQNIQVLAISADGSHKAQLKLLTAPSTTTANLKRLLQSNLLGTQGHFDGIVQGSVQGWAARKYQKEPVSVWLQCEGHEPIKLLCNQYREAMEDLELPNKCGFSMRIEALPEDWTGKAIHCSFDQEGQFLLPQNESVFLQAQPLVEVFDAHSTAEQGGYISHIDSSTDELRVHWEHLEMLRVILDEFESKLDQRDNLAATPVLPPRKGGWIRRLFGRSG